MRWSCHNSETPFFAESGWSKLSLLRDTEPESSKRNGKIRIIATSPGTRTFVNVIRRPLVVTVTRPQANICFKAISVTSLKSQGRVSKV
jgi:hypothetical protein